jgi:hypothetical protein
VDLSGLDVLVLSSTQSLHTLAFLTFTLPVAGGIYGQAVWRRRRKGNQSP